MNPQFVAALALAKIANQRGSEPIIPLPTEAASPVLIEGTLIHHILSVTIPTGHTWLFSFGVDGGPNPRKLLVMIDHGTPQCAQVFQPSCDTVHPFVGVAQRFGVNTNERGAA